MQYGAILAQGKVFLDGNQEAAGLRQAEINATASGDTTVVTGVSGRVIRVIGLVLVCAAAVSVAWKTGATTTRINPQAFAANGGMAYNAFPGWFYETDSGDNAVINLSAAVNVRGSLYYVLV